MNEVFVDTSALYSLQVEAEDNHHSGAHRGTLIAQRYPPPSSRRLHSDACSE